MVLAAPVAALGADKPKQNQDAPASRYERVKDPSLYVGAETCKTCHEDIFKNFETTPHFVTTLENKRGPEWQGCEACHGPGKEHVESGGDKTKIFTFKERRPRSPARVVWTATPTEKNTATLRGRRTCRTTSAASTVIPRTTPRKANA